jgi:adenylosuccinate synthase
LAELQKVTIVSEQEIFSRFETVIFEGLRYFLDQEYGFFPHVTRANTTSKNAMALIREHDLGNPHVYYITRAYLTRHGNGPMANEGSCLSLINIEKETNVQNDWQGNFRRSFWMWICLIMHYNCDANYTTNASKHLVVTCLDQIQGPF